MPSPHNQRTTADIGMPKKSDGTKDKRYNQPQILKDNGQRDKRCSLLSDKKKK